MSFLFEMNDPAAFGKGVNGNKRKQKQDPIEKISRPEVVKTSIPF
jgi:hypothetical protein